MVSYVLLCIDGIAQSPGDWVFDCFDQEMTGHLRVIIERQNTVLLGLTTYDEWSESWASSTREPFASFINNTPKYVASTTLSHAAWCGSTVIRSVADELQNLKLGAGRDIGVHGSIHLVRWLLQTGLLDELKIAVFPVTAGKGQRLFDHSLDMQRLDLVGLERTGKGVVLMTYVNPEVGKSGRSSSNSTEVELR